VTEKKKALPKAKQKGRGHVKLYLTLMIPTVAAYQGQPGMLSILMVAPNVDGGEDVLQVVGQEDSWRTFSSQFFLSRKVKPLENSSASHVCF